MARAASATNGLVAAPPPRPAKLGAHRVILTRGPHLKVATVPGGSRSLTSATMASASSAQGRGRFFRRARTAASLPGRVVACEDRCSALETRVGETLEEMRVELGEIRALLSAKLDADADTSELVGRLLRSAESRLGAIEERLEPADIGQLIAGTEERTD